MFVDAATAIGAIRKWNSRTGFWEESKPSPVISDTDGWWYGEWQGNDRLVNFILLALYSSLKLSKCPMTRYDDRKTLESSSYSLFCLPICQLSFFFSLSYAFVLLFLIDRRKGVNDWLKEKILAERVDTKSGNNSCWMQNQSWPQTARSWDCAYSLRHLHQGCFKHLCLGT